MWRLITPISTPSFIAALEKPCCRTARVVFCHRLKLVNPWKLAGRASCISCRGSCRDTANDVSSRATRPNKSCSWEACPSVTWAQHNTLESSKIARHARDRVTERWREGGGEGEIYMARSGQRRHGWHNCAWSYPILKHCYSSPLGVAHPKPGSTMCGRIQPTCQNCMGCLEQT